MTVTTASFRNDFPEFADTKKYPNSLVQFWLTLATKLLNPERWHDVLDEGIELYVAHNVTLQAQSLRSAAAGGSPGGGVGIQNNKHVDKVSVGYDTTSGTIAGAGQWNLTTYGIRYYQLMLLMGAGPIQIGADGYNGYPNNYFPVYAGGFPFN
jgi:hypothetical protein